MNNTFDISFGSDSTQFSSGGLRLEQKWKKDESVGVSFKDVQRMFSNSRRNVSAYSDIMDNCPQAIIEDDVISVYLKFYVWPSSKNMVYSLTSNIGSISGPTVIEDHTEFSVNFQRSKGESLPYIFEGDVTPDMPILSPAGSEYSIEDVGVTISNNPSVIQLSKEVFCSFRAKGLRFGFEHTLEIKINKAVEIFDNLGVSNPKYKTSGLMTAGGDFLNAEFPIRHSKNAKANRWKILFYSDTNFRLYDETSPSTVIVQEGSKTNDFVTNWFVIDSGAWGDNFGSGDYIVFNVIDSNDFDGYGYKIENLMSSVTAKWVDESGEDQEESLSLEIPDCVAALLADCSDGKSKSVIGCFGRDCNSEEELYTVYYSDCDGDVLLSQWEPQTTPDHCKDKSGEPMKTN